VPNQREQDDDRDWHTEQPEQDSSPHDRFSFEDPAPPVGVRALPLERSTNIPLSGRFRRVPPTVAKFLGSSSATARNKKGPPKRPFLLRRKNA
jgi:hypothetical protein